MNTKFTITQESQPLIRHCLNYSIYGKKLKTTLYKEKFVNFLMKDGKKSKAYNIFNRVGILIKKKLNSKEKHSFLFTDHKEALEQMKKLHRQLVEDLFKEPLQKKKKQTNKQKKKDKQQGQTKTKLSSFNSLLIQAIDNVKPSVEVRKVRIAGTTYLVPAIIPKSRQQTLAIKWLVASARSKKRTGLNSFSQNLANELVDASKKIGQARQKRDDLHKIAEANRAYIRYRWW